MTIVTKTRVAAAAALVLLAGCATYAPTQIGAMSTVDICELQNMQGPNLSPETKRAIQSELERRKDNCRNHAAEVAQRYEDFLAREMYGRHDDP